MKNCILAIGFILFLCTGVVYGQNPAISVKFVPTNGGPSATYKLELYAKGIDGYRTGDASLGDWVGMNIRADILFTDATGVPIPPPYIQSSALTVNPTYVSAGGSALVTGFGNVPVYPPGYTPPANAVPFSLNLSRDGQTDLPGDFPTPVIGDGVLIATLTFTFTAALPPTNIVDVRPYFATFPTAATGSFWANTVTTIPRRPIIVEDGPLPVKLISFAAERERNTSVIEWSTSEETGASHFEIQRSSNMREWVEVGRELAGGESTSLREYQFTDIKPKSGNNYYRLKMVDLDGTFAYSVVRNVSFESGSRAEVSTFPNPVSDELKIEHDEWKSVTSMLLLDQTGKTVIQNFNPINTVNVKSVPTGSYVLQLTHKDGSKLAKKVVVVH